MRALKHFVGVTGIAITLDYFLFNGYCTNVSGELFSQAYIQILSELGKSLRGFLWLRLNREPVATIRILSALRAYVPGFHWSFGRSELVKEPIKSNRAPNQEGAAWTNETGTKWKLHDEEAGHAVVELNKMELG
jgi:hypothetical protein